MADFEFAQCLYRSTFCLHVLGCAWWQLRCSPVPVFGCGHSQPPPRGAAALWLHYDTVLAGQEKESLSVYPSGRHHGKWSTVCSVTPRVKPSCTASGMSSWHSLCWITETESLVWSELGVFTTPPTVLPVWHPMGKLLQNEAYSFRETVSKRPKVHIWFSQKH